MSDSPTHPPASQRASDIDLLRVSAADLGKRADVRRELEQLLQDQLGVRVKHERSIMIVPPRSNLHAYIRTGRTHTKHSFRVLGEVHGVFSSLVRNGRIDLFVKAGTKLRISPLDDLLNQMLGQGVRQPYYWGAVTLDDGVHLGAWEFVEGVRMPFEELPVATQVRLVQAIATFNSIPVQGLPSLTKWVTAPLSWYNGRFQRFSEDDKAKWQGALARLGTVLEGRDLVRDVIGGFGERLLTHNDMNPNNVFTPAEGDVIVFDWEGSTQSVPGADLRFLVRMPTRELLLAAYVERMALNGIHLEVADVKRAYEILEAFRRIYKGWAGHNLSAVSSGLTMAETHVLAPSLSRPSNNSAGSREGRSVAGAPATTRKTGIPDSGEKRMVANATTTKPSGPAPASLRAPSRELADKVEKYVMDKGHLYAPVDHPAFVKLPSKWGPDRFDLFAPHLEYKGGTALDIGSHWGYMAQRLEMLGYKVTACEHSPKHVYFLRELRDLSEYHFDVIAGDIFDMQKPDFDVMIALNIFHHFLKTEERFQRFTSFLERSRCGMMIYQSHRSAEKPKLDMAGHYMEPLDMAKFIADRLRLPKVEPIGVHGKRDIFKLSQ